MMGRGQGRAAARQAGSVAIAGLSVNAAVALTTLIVARLMTPDEYGTFVQLVSVFYVLSMAGSALLVAVVRRATAQPSDWSWATPLRLRVLGISAVATVLTLGLAGPLVHASGISSAAGLVVVVAAGGSWAGMCLERGLVQA